MKWDFTTCFFLFNVFVFRLRVEEKAAFDKKMKERKMQRAMAERKKTQGGREARNAFKEKLEANTEK